MPPVSERCDPASCVVPSREMSQKAQQSSEDLWVFGYGSLMWRPGFEYVERRPARLVGAHRALCVYSFVHRGTPEKPGLVLGLDRGGACRGIAFRVAGHLREATIDYLRSREQTTHVYREVTRSVWLDNEARERVAALTYVVDRSHVQYAGRLSLAEGLIAVTVALVKPGKGAPDPALLRRALRKWAFNTVHREDLKPDAEAAALRWIAHMTKQELLVRRPDPRDGRRVFIALSEQAAAVMHNYLAAARRIVAPAG